MNFNNNIIGKKAIEVLLKHHAMITKPNKTSFSDASVQKPNTKGHQKKYKIGRTR